MELKRLQDGGEGKYSDLVSAKSNISRLFELAWLYSWFIVHLQ
jgi:hypothetical protein